MPLSEPLPGPCALCGGAAGTRTGGALACAVCGWRCGDAPDFELPMPRVDVVYYVRFDRRVKIGTSARPRQRLAALRYEELLAFEPGGRPLEHERHMQFAALRGTGEWFRLEEPLARHIEGLRADGEPWSRYARWVAAALGA